MCRRSRCPSDWLRLLRWQESAIKTRREENVETTGGRVPDARGFPEMLSSSSVTHPLMTSGKCDSEQNLQQVTLSDRAAYLRREGVVDSRYVQDPQRDGQLWQIVQNETLDVSWTVSAQEQNFQVCGRIQ